MRTSFVPVGVQIAASTALALFVAGTATAQSCLWTLHPLPTTSSPFLPVYDTAAGSTLLITTGSPSVSVWQWNGSGWTVLWTAGPSPRNGAAVFDSARGRVVLSASSPQSVMETWEWNGATWSLVTSSGPAVRSDHSMAYDSARQRTVLFGGRAGATNFGDTWEYDGQAWTLVATSGPSARRRGAMAFDSARDKTVLYGGTNQSTELSDLWEWDGASWMQRPTNAPGGGALWLAFDSGRERMVLGRRLDTTPLPPQQTWEMDVHTAQWTLRDPGTTSFSPGVYDPGSATIIFASRRFHPSATVVPPYITSQTQLSGPPVLGGTISISATAAGGEPLAYQWRHDGQPLVDGGNISGAITPTLTIGPLGFMDDGGYNLVVSNSCSTVASNFVHINTEPTCYANCDNSTAPPVLNVADFTCFLQRFAAGHQYANCDQSNPPPILNVADFTCFLQRYAFGCP